MIDETEIEKRQRSAVLTLIAVELEATAATDMLEAIKAGNILEQFSVSFQMLFHADVLYIKNLYESNRFVKIVNVGRFDLAKNSKVLFALGCIPAVLKSFVNQINIEPLDNADSNFWQYPCATEKQAFENHLSMNFGDNLDVENGIIHIYVPLPWATYIDRKSYPASYLNRIRYLLNIYKTIASSGGIKLKVHSVCQHIHWKNMLKVAKGLGITDLHLSHKDSKSEHAQKELGFSFSLHGWPLIAVNYVTPELSEGMSRKAVGDKKLLASFIGAHMPHYLDDSRVKLFEAAKDSEIDKVFVDLGDEWCFNKIVYEEQVLNKEIEAHHIDEHHASAFRYNTILSDSIFSLCPIGAGPNTLRLWESIAVGAIPVLFDDDLSVLNESVLGRQILDNCIVWKGEPSKNLFEILQLISNEQLSHQSKILMTLYAKIQRLKITQAVNIERKPF
jgi:hypothetical protein